MRDDVKEQSAFFLNEVKKKLNLIGYKKVETTDEFQYLRLFHMGMQMTVWVDNNAWQAGGLYYLSAYMGSQIDVKFTRDLIACINEVVQETGQNVELGIEFSVQENEDDNTD
jgi:hypothetical protein